MLGGSGLGREKLHEACVLAHLTIQDGSSSDPGVREEEYSLQLDRDVISGVLTQEDKERALYAFRQTVLPAELRTVPVAERGLPSGGLILGEPEF